MPANAEDVFLRHPVLISEVLLLVDDVLSVELVFSVHMFAVTSNCLM